MIKATLRRPTPAQKPTIDVTAHVVDEGAADALVRELTGETETVSANTETTTAVVAKAGSFSDASGGALEGDFDSGDIKLPQLKIVNGSGPLSREHNQGTLLYADEVLWLPPSPAPGAVNPTMRVVPVKVIKQFRENLTEEEIKEKLMPRVVSSKEEADRLGGPGSTLWVDNRKPRFSPSAKLILLLQEPEGTTHSAFNTVLDGANWAPCVYYSAGTAYNESAKAIFNAAQISLRQPDRSILLCKKVWTWQVVKKLAGQYVVFVPLMRMLRDETGPEVREMARSIGGDSRVITVTE
jgi:hypothetical protein